MCLVPALTYQDKLPAARKVIGLTIFAAKIMMERNIAGSVSSLLNLKTKGSLGIQNIEEYLK